MTLKFWAVVCAVANLLLFLFVVLKFTGYIAWSWWWVFAPIWIPAAIVGIVFAIIVAVCLYQH